MALNKVKYENVVFFKRQNKSFIRCPIISTQPVEEKATRIFQRVAN